MRVAEGPCPACGKALDRDSGFRHDKAPDAGDVSICIGCHAVLQYLEDPYRDGVLVRTVMSQEELDKMPAEHRSTLETALSLLGKGRKEVKV